MIVISLIFFIYLSNSQLHYIIATVLFSIGYSLIYSTLNANTVNAVEIENQSITATSQIFTLFYFIGIFGFPYIARKIIYSMGISQLLVVLLVTSMLEILLMVVGLFRNKHFNNTM